MKLRDILKIFNGETLFAIGIQGVAGHFSPVYSEKIPETFKDYEVLQCGVSGNCVSEISCHENKITQKLFVVIDLKNPMYSSGPEQ